MSENRYRFEEIIGQIRDLLEEAIDLVPEDNRPRAESYWYAHISTSLDNNHDYLGSSMCCMHDTLEEWPDSEEQDDD